MKTGCPLPLNETWARVAVYEFFYIYNVAASTLYIMLLLGDDDETRQ